MWEMRFSEKEGDYLKVGDFLKGMGVIPLCAKCIRSEIWRRSLTSRLVSLTQFQVTWEPLVSIRSSRPEVLCKNVALKYFENSQENTCARVSFLSCWGLHLLTQVFYCDFYKFFTSAFFTEYLMWLLLKHLHFLLILAKIFQECYVQYWLYWENQVS